LTPNTGLSDRGGWWERGSEVWEGGKKPLRITADQHLWRNIVGKFGIIFEM